MRTEVIETKKYNAHWSVKTSMGFLRLGTEIIILIIKKATYALCVGGFFAFGGRRVNKKGSGCRKRTV